MAVYPWKVHNHSNVFGDEILKQQYGPPTEKKEKGETMKTLLYILHTCTQ